MIQIKCSSCGFIIFKWNSKDGSLSEMIKKMKKELVAYEFNGRVYIVCPCCLSPLTIDPKTLEIIPIKIEIKCKSVKDND